MDMIVKVNTKKLSQAQKLALRQIVSDADGSFYESPLQAFAFEEARMRVNDHLGHLPQERGVIDDVADALTEYLTDDEEALNYDGIDNIVDTKLNEEDPDFLKEAPKPDAVLDDCQQSSTDSTVMSGFKELINSMNSKELKQAAKIVQEAYYDVFRINSCSIDIGEGRRLIASAEYSFSPEIQILLADGDTKIALGDFFARHGELISQLWNQSSEPQVTTSIDNIKTLYTGGKDSDPSATEKYFDVHFSVEGDSKTGYSVFVKAPTEDAAVNVVKTQKLYEDIEDLDHIDSISEITKKDYLAAVPSEED